jgi:general secretion pathway protein D
MMKRILLLFMAGLIIASAMGCAGSRAFQRGESYSQHGEWDLAVKEYRDALKTDPKNIEYRSALLRAEETAANEHYKKARSFLKERKLDQAITELQQALFLNPTSAAVQGALKSVLNMKRAEEHYRAALTFQELNRLSEAVNELKLAVELDPETVKYSDALDKLERKKSEAEPEEALTLSSDKPITLNFKNTNIREAFEVLAKLAGINIMFDDDVKAQPVTVFVKDVSFQYALNLLLSTNKLFMKKISADTIIIIPKNKAKMDQYQDLLVKTFYLNNAKSKDAVNLLRSMLDIKKVYVNDVLNSLTVRETPEKLKLIEKILNANDLKEAEVVLDVEILEIARSNSFKFGWNFSGDPFATAHVQADPNNSATALTLGTIHNITSDNIILTLPSIILNLLKQDSDAQILANPRVRVLNNKQAKFHIGDRIPIQTATVQSTATAAVTSTFEYKDVGIKLNIEPSIHLNNTVTLKMGLEISNLGDAIDFGNGQKQYKFGTRNADTVINLRDGESVIIGGLIKDEERKGHVKVPFLGDIPVVGKLFSSTDEGTIKTDILMSITPNIVRNMELPDKDVQNFWSGTEDTFDTKPVFMTTGKSSRPGEKTAVEAAENAAAPAGGAALASTATKTAELAKPVPVFGVTSSPATADQGAPVLVIKPSDVAVQVGQEMRFDLNASAVKKLYGAIITLTYDPAVVEFKVASEGDFLKKDGQQTSFLFSNNVQTGTVDIYLTRIGDVGGVDGSGTLCSIVFQGKSGGASEVQFKAVKLTNAAREQITSGAKGTKISVETSADRAGSGAATRRRRP